MVPEMSPGPLWTGNSKRVRISNFRAMKMYLEARTTKKPQVTTISMTQLSKTVKICTNQKCTDEVPLYINSRDLLSCNKKKNIWLKCQTCQT